MELQKKVAELCLWKLAPLVTGMNFISSIWSTKNQVTHNSY